MTLVFMGVSGCGKSTLGKLVAGSLGCPFVEGDEFHPPANVQRMREGIPLNDDDRAGWLNALASEIRRHRKSGRRVHLCLSCSALKRSYRQILRSGDPDLLLIHLHGDRKTLEGRVQGRQHEFMPASLLDSQLAALEIPGAEENCLEVDISLTPDAQAGRVLAHLESRHS